MSDEIKDFETVTPTLTFDPFEEVKEPMPETAKEMAVEDAAFNENTLTPEERQMVENFSQQIELTNSNMIMQYGAGAQKKIADFSETALDSVKSKDLGEIGNMLTNMVTELKSFDVQEEERGFFGFFKKSANKITAMRAKYATAETNVNKISEILEGHQIQLMKDVAMLDKILKNCPCIFWQEKRSWLKRRARSCRHWWKNLRPAVYRRMPRQPTTWQPCVTALKRKFMTLSLPV